MVRVRPAAAATSGISFKVKKEPVRPAITIKPGLRKASSFPPASQLDRTALEIYSAERLKTIGIIERNLQTIDQADYPERELFLAIEQQVVAGSTERNLRHLSFVLKEAAEIDGDYITASAVLLHNKSERDIDLMLKHRPKKPKKIDEIAAAVKKTVEIFKKLNAIHYRPPVKMHDHFIQDFMNSLVKLSEGNGHALQVFFAHQLSSIVTTRTMDAVIQPEDTGEITSRAVEEIFAPSVERFGMTIMASKLRDQAFRLSDPERHRKIEDEIIGALSMASRKEADAYLNEIETNLKIAFSESACGCVSVFGRVKTPWSAKAKMEYKPEKYPDPSKMKDLLACTIITDNYFELGEACDLVQSALGGIVHDFDYQQCETKTKRIKDQTGKCHHIVIDLISGKSVEIQVVDKRSYAMFDKGPRAHWVYKLEELTKKAYGKAQRFDEKLIGQCAEVMNGDFLHDVKIVYDILSPWIYVFILEGSNIRPLRLNAGAIPIDVAVSVLNGRYNQYGGAKVRKIWENPERIAKKASESSPLQDGHCLSFNPLDPNYIKRIGISGLIARAKHPETKLKLYPLNDEPPSSRRGKK